ncbi:hypothetical protein [Propioniciclava flava]
MSAAADIVSELERVRDDYRRLIAAATPEELLAPTWGTRWTNRELLFHMWFGQHLARVFVPLFGGFGRLPRRVSIGHARILTALTRPYNWVNYAGPVAGVRVVGLRRAEHWMNLDTDRLVNWSRRATPSYSSRWLSPNSGIPTSRRG